MKTRYVAKKTRRTKSCRNLLAPLHEVRTLLLQGKSNFFYLSPEFTKPI